MRAVSELVRDLLGDLRQTLPSTEDEAGAFVAGMAWAFVLHWLVLICVTWQHCASRGGC